MLIQLQGEQKNRYIECLDTYERVTGKNPTAKERTEAFFWATSKDYQRWCPCWMM
jgi:hypothetical protein